MGVKANETLPLVYACSGCSSVAQMANDLALRLDRGGLAEMSCIAGVGGDVKPLLRTARSGRPILALDGCRLNCVRSSLSRHGITPARHVMLGNHGVRKMLHGDYDATEADRIFDELSRDLTERPLASCAR